MRNSILISGLVLSVLMAGCGDNAPKNEVSHIPKKIDKAQEPSTLKSKIIEKVVVKRVTVPAVRVEKTVETLAPTVASTNTVQGGDALDIAKSVASVEIAQSVSDVNIARAQAAKVIAGAVSDVETGVLEDKYGVEDASGLYAKERAHTATIMRKEVTYVQNARAASAAKIVSSVKAVDAARAKNAADAPMSANSVEVVKAASAASMARSVASVEIAKAKAVSNMANATALVEVHSRVYGDGSDQVKRAEAIAAGMIAKSVGDVNVAKADALGEISESVAAVEVAKAKAGILDVSVQRGQKLYLKHIKTACNMNGAKFAAMHTQAEWKALYHRDAFASEVLGMCPHLEVYDKAWSVNLFSFVETFASDSGKVPSCH